MNVYINNVWSVPIFVDSYILCKRGRKLTMNSKMI